MKDVSPQRWSEIESVLDEALDAEPADRQAVVERLCGEDEDLKSRVMSLLDAGDQAADFLEEPQRRHFERALMEMAAEEEESGEDPHLNRTVGPYRLIRRLGHGGMGQVYLGARADDAFDKFVAVKLIRRGMDTEEILQRFRTERRILASLVHPNIARLLDGGATEDGLSYFVMDFVDGKPITEYADDNLLSIRERLDLFKKVCAAVHYAHQNLIVHRDLKPSNILVDGDGEVKLLDFGIAKFLRPEETDFTVPVTREEVRIMTPEYASPEQARGEAITTASDVYQLGILLYELLTGTRPYEFSNERRAEIERIICETEPERPSTAITGASPATENTRDVGEKRKTPIDRLRKQLSGDLDRIVLMALRKEADRRYQSADQFLEDINRYLAGLPVHAQSDTFVYRAGKFVRRHRYGVLATAAVAILLVTTSVVAVQSAVTTAKQNREIQVALQKKDQVKDLMIGMFEVSDPEIARGREITARELLDRSRDRIENELADQPDVQAEMYHSVGTVYRQLGYFDEAKPLLEKALEIRRRLYGSSDNADLAQSIFDVALVYEEDADAETSIRLHEEALAMRQRLFQPPNAAIAQSLNELGAVYQELLQDAATAEGYYMRALEMRMELEGPESRAISETMVNLASVYQDRKEFARAEDYYSRGLAMERKLLGNDHPFVAATLYNYATLEKDLGQFESAEMHARESRDLRARLYGDDSGPVANTLNLLGQILNKEGKYSEARQALQRALELHIVERGVRVHPRVGRDLQILGESYLGENDLPHAASSLEEAVSIYEATLPPGAWLLAEGRVDLAAVRLEQNRLADAESLLRSAIAAYIGEFTEDSREVAEARLLLGRCLTRTSDYAEAGQVLQQSRDFFASGGPTFAARLADVDQALEEWSTRSGQPSPQGG